MANIFMMNKEIARGMVCFFHQKKHFYLIKNRAQSFRFGMIRFRKKYPTKTSPPYQGTKLLRYCTNECIFRSRFVNIVAYAYTSCCAPCHVYMPVWICLDIASFPIACIMCASHFFVLMWYKKMPQRWIYIQSLSCSCSVRSLVESGHAYQ
jgi:hypothetical protein